ncbi:hypothetical protein GYMLUDRAFT_48401 [Collybiopsis luxurians FD-317 M1]|uniref:Unplaced genomic scaffold GYMLUscaffold_64, whole genome shotgun sequence n=1 Tax=Collybiopsis luxurians FD-317 M1 TaxID=944289 RepID=A0A0D0CA21_9AGAR|nr:hypothetical protein GYMLUDRAFT_48401 [Collybiopsis luxurians FD-317 M1]
MDWSQSRTCEPSTNGNPCGRHHPAHIGPSIGGEHRNEQAEYVESARTTVGPGTQRRQEARHSEEEE